MEDSDIIALFFERSENAIKEIKIKYGGRCKGEESRRRELHSVY